jgi:hypothetical protein
MSALLAGRIILLIVFYCNFEFRYVNYMFRFLIIHAKFLSYQVLLLGGLFAVGW